jgi:hypothetical protein
MNEVYPNAAAARKNYVILNGMEHPSLEVD